jgi:hypothetical protein
LRLYFFTVARPPMRATSLIVNSRFFDMGRSVLPTSGFGQERVRECLKIFGQRNSRSARCALTPWRENLPMGSSRRCIPASSKFLGGRAAPRPSRSLVRV